MHVHLSIQNLTYMGTPEKPLIGFRRACICSIKGNIIYSSSRKIIRQVYSLPKRAMYTYKAFLVPLLCILSTHHYRKIMLTAVAAVWYHIAFLFFQIIKTKTRKKRKEILEMLNKLFYFH